MLLSRFTAAPALGPTTFCMFEEPSRVVVQETDPGLAMVLLISAVTDMFMSLRQFSKSTVGEISLSRPGEGEDHYCQSL